MTTTTTTGLGDDDDYVTCDSSDEYSCNPMARRSTITASALPPDRREVDRKQEIQWLQSYVLYDILDDANVDCFSTLEEVVPFIEKYEVRSGNRLRVQRSICDRFKQFQCMEHVDCPFRVLISRRRSDGMFCVRKITGMHSEVCRPKQAADGRKWKKRRNAVLDDVIDQIVRTKKGSNTGGRCEDSCDEVGVVVSYMTAYRALRFQTSSMRNASVKNFEMVIPFLEGLKKTNPGSVIGYTRDEEKRLVDLHVFPGIMNGLLKFVRPVVSLDATHLRKHKGTLYISSQWVQ
ncbi:hypothetical protein MHU86_25176 [Fragilaria crotonensis]|nr:hypothetical protein MHU86_25176 [Fragilaria crotonensis]